MKKIVNILGRLSYLLSRLGCVALFAMMGLTVVDVIGRYIFNSPILGSFEMTKFLVLVMVFSFLGFAQSQKAHVNVDLLYETLPKAMRKAIDIVNFSVSFAVVFIMSWMAFQKGIETFHTGEKPLNLAIPNYPFVFFLSFGAAVMCGEFLRDIIRQFNERDAKKNES